MSQVYPCGALTGAPAQYSAPRVMATQRSSAERAPADSKSRSGALMKLGRSPPIERLKRTNTAKPRALATLSSRSSFVSIDNACHSVSGIKASRTLIRRNREWSRERDCDGSVLSSNPHPREFERTPDNRARRSS